MSKVGQQEKILSGGKVGLTFLTIQALEHCPCQVLKLNRENVVVVVSVLRGEWKRFFESGRRIMQKKKTKKRNTANQKDHGPVVVGSRR